jgi:sugar lactone lactonase YvrE
LNSIAVDAAGNLYIADGIWADGDGGTYGNNRIRKVDSSGTISTVAGDGTMGFSGDGGPGVNAQLDGPQSLTVDGAGNLFFSDFSNRRIRELSADGTINTVVDLGLQVPGCVSTVNPYSFCSAAMVTLHPSGNLVFSCIGVRYGTFGSFGVFTRSSAGTITNVVESDVALEIGLSGQIAMDSGGNLWFGAGSSLRKIAPDGTLTVVLGDGAGGGGDGRPATSIPLQHVNSVAADGWGNLFIADADNYRIRKVSGGIITTVAGPGVLNINCDAQSDGSSAPATAAQLCSPSQVAADGGGNIFIVDRNRIRKVSADGSITSIAGDGTVGDPAGGDGGPATQALAHPNSVAVDSAGNIYFAEWARIRKISPDGTIVTVAGTGAKPGNNGCLPPPSPSCGTGDGGPAKLAQLWGPTSVTVDGAGNLYFVDRQLIRKVSPDGIIATAAGNGGATGYHGYTGDGGLAVNAPLWNPNSVAADNAGNLYISEPVRVRKTTTDGIISTIAGTQEPGFSGDGGTATQAQFWNPTGLTVDAAGNVYVADSNNNRIRILKPAR